MSHDIAFKGLKLFYSLGLLKLFFRKSNSENAISADIKGTEFSLKLNNRLGIAAGLDKDGEYIDCLAAMGIGFVEVGTVTPKQQLGNPKPRIFRLEKDQALINRLGFNNHGSETVSKRISNNFPDGFLGINIGPNKDTKNKADDYYICLSRLAAYAGYITINISSPNTEGLRNFHDQEEMKKLLSGINKVIKEKKIEFTSSNHQYNKKGKYDVAIDYYKDALKICLVKVLQCQYNTYKVLTTEIVIFRISFFR